MDNWDKLDRREIRDGKDIKEGLVCLVSQAHLVHRERMENWETADLMADRVHLAIQDFVDSQDRPGKKELRDPWAHLEFQETKGSPDNQESPEKMGTKENWALRVNLEAMAFLDFWGNQEQRARSAFKEIWETMVQMEA